MADITGLEELLDATISQIRADHPGLFDTPEHGAALESVLLDVLSQAADETWTSCALTIAEHLNGMLDEDLLDREMPPALQAYVKRNPIQNYVDGLLGVRDLAVDIALQIAEGDEPVTKTKAEMEAEYQSFVTAERIESVEQDDGTTKLVPIAKKVN